jgi:hypothetical protein
MRPLLAALLVAAAPAGAAEVDAPLGVRTQGTLRELFLDVTLSDARPPARAALDVRWAAANSWTTPTAVTRGGSTAVLWLDEQADSLTLLARVPWTLLGARGATAIEWRLTQHWGGWTDPIISTWHDVIRVYDFRRRRFGRGEVHLRLGGVDERGALRVDGDRLAPGDLVLRNQLAVLRGGLAEDGRDRWAIALRLDLKAPTGPLADAGGSGGWDAGGAVVATAALTRFSTLHGLVSATAVSRLPPAAIVQPERLQLGAEISLALHGRRWALLLEDRVSSGLLEGGWRYAGGESARRSSGWAASFRPHNQVSIGLRRTGLLGGAFTAWFSEDVTPGSGDPTNDLYYLSNAPDLTIGLGFARAL